MEFTHFYLHRVERLEQRPKSQIGKNRQRLHLVPMTEHEAAQFAHLLQRRSMRHKQREQAVQNMCMNNGERQMVNAIIVGPYIKPGRIWIVESQAMRAATVREEKELRTKHLPDFSAFKPQRPT